MGRTASALLSCALAFLTSGCLGTSEVQLSLFISEAALDSVADFPVRVIIDMGKNDNYEIHICDWQSGFLETELTVGAYDKCPEPLTIEGVMVPLTDACNEGAFQFTSDWHEEGTLIYGRGSLDVFEAGYCNTVEQRQLEIRAIQ